MTNPRSNNRQSLHRVVDEVIMLAEITRSLRDRVLDALRDPECENCSNSAMGICTTHRTGNGVFNMRVNVHPFDGSPPPVPPPSSPDEAAAARRRRGALLEERRLEAEMWATHRLREAHATSA